MSGQESRRELVGGTPRWNPNPLTDANPAGTQITKLAFNHYPNFDEHTFTCREFVDLIERWAGGVEMAASDEAVYAVAREIAQTFGLAHVMVRG